DYNFNTDFQFNFSDGSIQIANAGAAPTGGDLGAGTLNVAGAVGAATYVSTSGSRAVNTGMAADTLAAATSSTFESNNTASGAFTVTIAAPVYDGERRRICFKNATGTITWTVTSPATATVGLPTNMSAAQCIEMVYNSVAGIPTHSAA